VSRGGGILRGSLRRAWAVARKELRQLMRDQLTLGFVVGVPIVQLVLFGYAINQDIRHVATAVVDQASTETSRRLSPRVRSRRRW
jgi:ABC-2 type transport system permease protein